MLEVSYMRLEGKKIAVLVAEEFEDAELAEPVKAMETEGAQVTLISLGHDAKHGLVGKHGTVVTTDATIDEVDPADFSALFIPGGQSPARLRNDKRILDFVRGIATANKPIAAICHGPQVLISAGIVTGRIMTSYPAVGAELEEAGATYVDQSVALDGNIVTSRRPADIPEFIESMLRLMERAREAA